MVYQVKNFGSCIDIVVQKTIAFAIPLADSDISADPDSMAEIDDRNRLRKPPRHFTGDHLHGQRTQLIQGGCRHGP
jgi:hypothetical protein